MAMAKSLTWRRTTTFCFFCSSVATRISVAVLDLSDRDCFLSVFTPAFFPTEEAPALLLSAFDLATLSVVIGLAAAPAGLDPVAEPTALVPVEPVFA